jgi:hypothetical protein
MHAQNKTLSALAERGMQRRLRIKSNQAKGFEEAEAWDLAYWQEMGPTARLEAYMAIRDDVEKVNRARDAHR